MLFIVGVILLFSGAYSLGTGSVGVVVVLVIAGAALMALSVKKLRNIQNNRHFEDKKL
ncbi:MAG: hypothetical protein ACOC2E_06810 [Bacteroidota bacterium]